MQLMLRHSKDLYKAILEIREGLLCFGFILNAKSSFLGYLKPNASL